MEEQKPELKFGIRNLLTGEIEDLVTESSDTETPSITWETPPHLQYNILKTPNIQPELLLAIYGGEIVNGQWVAPEPVDMTKWEYYLRRKNIAFFRHSIGEKFGIEFDLETDKGRSDFELIKALKYGTEVKINKPDVRRFDMKKLIEKGTLDFKGTVFPPKE